MNFAKEEFASVMKKGGVSLLGLCYYWLQLGAVVVAYGSY